MEWSRHYDTIQWVVAGISISATGALFLSCLNRASAEAHASTAQPYTYFLYLFGMLLPILGFIYASSYRRLRRVAHAELCCEEIFSPLLRSEPCFRTWPIVFIIHILLFTGWAYITYKHHAAYRSLLAFLAPTGIVTLTLYYHFTDTPPRRKASPLIKPNKARKIDLVHIERSNLILWFILIGLTSFAIGILYCRLKPNP